ncbi:MAG: hypothetical protein ABSH34_22595 [Verrucomicrobiota bacterium]
MSIYATFCGALRGNRAAVAAEILLPDGTHRIIRTRNEPSG